MSKILESVRTWAESQKFDQSRNRFCVTLVLYLRYSQYLHTFDVTYLKYLLKGLYLYQRYCLGVELFIRSTYGRRCGSQINPYRYLMEGVRIHLLKRQTLQLWLPVSSESFTPLTPPPGAVQPQMGAA